MKKPRNVEPTKVNPKLCRNRVKNLDFEDDIERKNFCDLSFPLFFSFWCLVVLFHGKFGVTRGNEGMPCFLYLFLLNFLPYSSSGISDHVMFANLKSFHGFKFYCGNLVFEQLALICIFNGL